MGGPPLGMSIDGVGPVGSRVLGGRGFLQSIDDQFVDFLAGLSHTFLF